MNKKTPPYVSVIIPVYKAPLKYFKACLGSLHSQTMSNAEFIIVFDGEDETLLSLCEDYERIDSRFKSYVQKHSGVSASRNFGIRQATGEYITFVDADDSIEKNCCLETYNFAKKNNSEVVLFDYNPTSNQYKQLQLFPDSISELPNKTIEILQTETIHLSSERYVAAVSTWCKLIKKDFIDFHHILFPTNLNICVDRPVSFSLFYFSNKISYLNKTFYNYNKVETSITWAKHNNKMPFILAYLAEIKKISTKFSELIGRYAMEEFLYSWSRNYFTNNNFCSASESVKKIQSIIKSSDFQHLIEKYDSSKWPWSFKLEAFLIKRKITFHIWLHAFKWKFLTHH